MAVKYIYKAKNRSEFLRRPLEEKRRIITRALEEVFTDNLKELQVREDSFDFILHISVPSGGLRAMGRELAHRFGTCYHFVRQPQRIYAVASQTDEYINIDFFDADVCDMTEEERQMRIYQGGRYRDDVSEWVNRMDYVDLYSTQLTAEEFARQFDEAWGQMEQGVEKLYEVKLLHRRVESRTLDQPEGTGGGRKAFAWERRPFFPIEHLYTGDPHYGEYTDAAKVVKHYSRRNCEKKLGRVKALIKIDLQSIQTVDPGLLGAVFPKGINTYTFRVHDVGQGLAASLSKGEQYFFYFDYGISYGYNRHTLPAKVDLPIAKGGVIVLSHEHEDHWCGFRLEKDALKATWIIPRQDPSLRFQKLLGSILYARGKVFFNDGITYKALEITHANTSALKPARLAKTCDKHETGYAMYLRGTDTQGNGRYIVVAGDQEYDYQEQSNLCGIDVLVACHHGGDYSWSKKGQVPTAGGKDSLVIYSYGDGNTYYHPTMDGHYTSHGWLREHHTAISGDYEETIQLDL